MKAWGEAGGLTALKLFIPEDTELYVQESGCAGRDVYLSSALLLYRRRYLNRRYTNDHMIMITYCKNETRCCKELIFMDFSECHVRNVAVVTWTVIGKCDAIVKF